MTNHHSNPIPGVMPDLGALAQQQLQRQQFAVQMIAGPQFTITVPFNATAKQRTQAVETARKLLIEMATGQKPDAPQELEELS